MIKNDLVLVLGAGASAPYGFPSGRELKNEVQRLHNRPDPFVQSFSPGKFDSGVFQDFATQLVQSPVDSIDAFLEARPQFIDIGKHVIAFLLIRKERAANLIGAQDWYNYLFRLMTREGIDHFQENQLTVVTYNYDRSFEFFFITGLMSTFGLSFTEAQNVFSSVEVIHVHGALGDLSENVRTSTARPYNQVTSAENVEIAAAGISIIHELQKAMGNWNEYQRAWQALQHAQTVVFIGFGYHKVNLARLLGKGFGKLRDNQMHGTTLGLTHSEVSSLVVPEFERYGTKLSQTRFSSTAALEYIRNSIHIIL